MITITDAIRSLTTDASFTVIGDEITWLSPDITQPTQSEIDAEAARLINVNALADMRTKRDRLLSESDWTQNRDVTLSNDSDWQTYRQALRDLPSGKTTKAHVDAATWPTKP